jgi:hypothetical protein
MVKRPVERVVDPGQAAVEVGGEHEIAGEVDQPARQLDVVRRARRSVSGHRCVTTGGARAAASQ